VFDLYVNERLGSRVIASQLNHQNHTLGHRRGPSPRVARPWSYPAVLTVLRNRVYLGEVFFRGTWHAAPHPPLIDQATFDAVRVILDERGEDLAKRRTNPSDCLLGGLIRCESCGHHMVGAAARGNGYRYYTCYRRQKYGTASCPTERINAAILDQEVLDALLDVHADQNLVDQAMADFLKELESSRPQRQAELARIAAESKEIEESLDRYFNAFESRVMSEPTCGSRVEALWEGAAGAPGPAGRAGGLRGVGSHRPYPG
jgi:site-specific DNA recombinase